MQSTEVSTVSVTDVEVIAESAADVAALIPRYSWELMNEGQRDALMEGIVLPRYGKTTSDGVAMGPTWWGHLVRATPNAVQKRVHRLQARAIAADGAGSGALHFSEWAQEERELRAQLEEGLTVVVNLKTHTDLVAWADTEGLLIKVDRNTRWGNPFILGGSPDGDGDRDCVVGLYREHYLPYKPSLIDRIAELRGRALGCWCAPEACHGDVLKEWADE